jgi:hypothetical protein
MTKAAREVLADCRFALEQMTDGIVGREWRVRWIGAITVCRAVGHVRHRVDGCTGRGADADMAGVIREARARLQAGKTDPANAIYFDLIEEDRNVTIKEYRLNAGVDIRMPVTAAVIRVIAQCRVPN